jgi:hypothetical protein
MREAVILLLREKNDELTDRHTGCSVIVWTLFVGQIKQISGRGEGLTKQ